MKYKKMKRITGVAALLLVLSVALVFSTSARTSEAAGKTDSGNHTASDPGADTTYLSETAPAYPDADMAILQTARIYSGAFGKVPGWRSAVELCCKFNRSAV